jgi:hypothetical protein
MRNHKGIEKIIFNTANEQKRELGAIGLSVAVLSGQSDKFRFVMAKA